MINVKPYLDTLERKTVAVLGLGASGLSTIKAFTKAGAEVYAWDDKEEGRENGAKAGAEIAELTTEILEKCDVLIVGVGD